MTLVRLGRVLAEEHVAEVAGASGACDLDAAQLRARTHERSKHGRRQKLCACIQREQQHKPRGECKRARTPWLVSRVIAMAPS